MMSSPKEIIKLEQHVTMEHAIKGQPMVMMIRTGQVKRSDLAKALDLQIVRLSMMMNVKYNVNDGQIETIVNDLLERYPYETLETFILVFKRLRQGYYPNLSFHELSESVIMRALELHLAELADERERLVKKFKGSREGQGIDSINRMNGIELLAQLVEKGLVNINPDKLAMDENGFKEFRDKYIREQKLKQQLKQQLNENNNEGLEPNGDEQEGDRLVDEQPQTDATTDAPVHPEGSKQDDTPAT